MKTWVYSKRNLKELLSDPLSLVFTIGLPAFLIVFMVSLNKNFSFNDAFKVENFVPASIIFSFAFLTMFTGILLAKDRGSSFLARMFVSPLKAHHYIIGYIFPVLMIAFIQTIFLYIIGFIIGLPFTIHVIASIPFLLIIALLFISFGLLFGSLLRDQQVGGVGSIFIQIVAFLSGMWFSLDLIGGAFKAIGKALPFVHAVDLIKSVLAANYENLGEPLLIVIIYIIVITVLAIFVFKKKMKD
jgi:ABC-2 type transport system permease protein